MKHSKLPQGWDESRVQRVLKAYENQTEEEAATEDEAGVAYAETVINVPHELVAEVRELIAKRHG